MNIINNRHNHNGRHFAAWLVAILLSVMPLCSWAGNMRLNLKDYTVEQGLSNSHVTSIIQDRKGFVWIGTNNGLNCFDGYGFRVFQKNPLLSNTLGSNAVTCLFEDSKENIWVGCKDGVLSCYDTRSETFTTYMCSFPMEMNKGDVSAIKEDGKGNIWITVDRVGFVRLDPQTGKMMRYRTNESTTNSLSHNALTGLEYDRKGNLLLTTWGGGLNVFDPRTNNYQHLMTQCDDNSTGRCSHLMKIFNDSKGQHWVASTHAGVFVLDRNNKPIKHFHTSSPGVTLGSSAVTSFTEDSNCRVWIGTASGLSIYSPQTATIDQVHSTDPTFAYCDITALMCDRDGSIWIGTTKGLRIYNASSSRFNMVNANDMQAPQGFVLAVLKDSKGRVWLREENRCVRISTTPDGRETVTDLRPFCDAMIAKAFYEDSKGRVWIGYYNDKITRYDLATDRFTHIKMEATSTTQNHNALAMRTVNEFYEDRDGSLWIALEVGLVNFNPATQTFKPVIQSRNLIYPDEKVNCVLRDSKGWLWVATQGGLRCYDKKLSLRKIYNPKDGDHTSLSSSNVTALCESRDGTLFVGTNSGLHRYNRDTDDFKAIIRPNMTFGDPVMKIFEAADGQLWISSSMGIIQYNPKTDTFLVYDSNDGLQRGEFNQGVGWQTKSGELLFGGINGANIFNPKDISSRPTPHKVFIDDFFIYNKSVVPGEDSPLKQSIICTDCIELNYKQSTISLQFTAIDYVSPEKVQYAYQMSNVDKQWIYTTADNRSATYANLAPGTYTFRVKATSGDGTWSDDVTEMKIIVNPPFWKTWWAYLIYIMLFIASIYAVLRYYNNKAKERANLEIERMMVRQQHEMDELKLQIFANISHEFRTSLTLILSPLEHILNKGMIPTPTTDRKEFEENGRLLLVMHRNALRLMRLINQLLDFRKSESGQMRLHASNQDLVAFMREVCDMFAFDAKQRSIELGFSSEEEQLEMAFDRDKMDKIIYNLLSNALKYTNSGGHVMLSLAKTEVDGEPSACIQVTDDGIGIDTKDKDAIFKLFYQSSDSDGRFRGGSGLGLSMTRELVELHEGKISVESEAGKGSCFTVIIPIGIKETISTEESIPRNIEASKPQNLITSEPQNLDSSKPNHDTILIVEDNSDMRDYISIILSPYYQVVTAEDGADGLAKAAETMPDIIISDVMMPRMDGVEMLTKLKADKTIGHIPVVMLTAVNDEQTVVGCLQKGVDEYITKPFSHLVLKARIDNIIARRQARREVSEYKQTYISPFVENMRQLIRENMSRQELNVDWLASEMNMSASQLTRKTKTLCDTTPYQIVIQTRMEAAVEMMKTTDLNVTEIAYRCGFQEVSNFSRSFTSYWKESPASYLKRVR